MKTTIGAALAALALVCAPARATDHRVWLAEHDDYNARRGWYLSLENTSTDPSVHLGGMKLVLGVADGSNWRYLVVTPAWQLDHDYTVKAVISPGNAQVYLNNVLQTQIGGGFAPYAETVDGDRMRSWALGPADYLISQSALSLSTNSGRSYTAPFTGETARPLAVRLFEPQNPQIFPWTSSAGETLTIQAAFHIQAAPNLQSLAPFVDRYGQSVQAVYAGKVTSDADLTGAIAEETNHAQGWSAPPDTDAYGGYKKAGWKMPATCYYAVTKHNGAWWLVSPDGNPVFYTGVCTADRAPFEKTPVTDRSFLFAELPPKTGPAAQAWGHDIWGAGDAQDYVSFYTANLAKKYGAAWYAQTPAILKRRVRQWGFTGMGKWSETIAPVPNLPVLFHGGVPNVSKHPDIFDPSVQPAFRNSLQSQMTPRLHDSTLLGWSVGNEIDEDIQPAEVTDIFTQASTVPAKRALVDYGVDTLYGGSVSATAAAWGVTAATRNDLYAATPHPSAADVEKLRQFYEGRYYNFIYTTVKAIDPNHLYFGCWTVPGYWVNAADWALITPNCDVIGYDRYAPAFSDAAQDALFAQSGKPVLCGEFSFPPTYRMARGFGVYDAEYTDDEAAAATAYEGWMQDAAANPYCVGTFWFQYRDEPVTGRGPGRGTALTIGEHYAFGLVDITDHPKWTLIDRLRAANLQAGHNRRAAFGQNAAKH